MAIAMSNHIRFGGYDYDLVDVLEHDRHICKICYFLCRDPYMGEYLFFKSCLDNAYKAAAIMPAQFAVMKKLEHLELLSLYHHLHQANSKTLITSFLFQVILLATVDQNFRKNHPKKPHKH